jgi:hypothetical protein
VSIKLAFVYIIECFCTGSHAKGIGVIEINVIIHVALLGTPPNFFYTFAAMITAIFVCLIVLTVVLITLLLWCIGAVTGIQKRMNVLLYTVSYIDLIQRKRFIRYLDQLSRKMSCNEDEMEDNQKQFLFHLSQELTSEIKRMEDDYKDLI